MTGKSKPIASLAALLDAVTERLEAVELRITEKVVAIDKQVTDLAFQVGEVHNRLVGIEDKATELGGHLDEVRDGLKSQIEEIQEALDKIDTDSIGDEIRFDLNELVDAERRRGLNEMRDELRGRRAS